ncbi:MAG: archaeosortase/exosortase family protein [Candidatus Nanoarchaeia archaeon]
MKLTLKDKPGFKQFLVKICLLLASILLLPLITYPILEMGRFPHAFPKDFFLVDIGMAIIFFAIALVLISKDKLFRLKKYDYDVRQGIVFGILALASLAVYLYSRIVISHNYDYYAYQNYALGLVFNLAPLLFFALFSILAVFNVRFVRDFVSDFKKELSIVSIMIVLYYSFNIFVRRSWFFLGDFVARSVAFLLGLSFDDVVLVDKGYNFNLGASGFIASIGDLCSGIDSIGLFTALFVLILAYDWKLLNKKRMFFVGVIGVIGAVFVNILRVYLLYLAGIFVSAEFAVGLFHSNIGMILFIIYFVVFWLVFYRWVKNEKVN